MQIQPVAMRCSECGHIWQGQLLVDCLIKLALLSMRSTRCPKCAASFRHIDIAESPDTFQSQKGV